jgi:NTE family protein
VELILAVREASRGRFGTRGQSALARHRFHMIEAGRYTAALSDDSKLKPDLGLFTYLHSAGRTQTHKWIGRHLNDIGKRETADLAARFQAPGAVDVAAVDEPEGGGDADVEASRA